MFEGFREFNVVVQPGVTIHSVYSGTGPPRLLLHGFPQTHHIWNRVARALASSYTVIAMDLRGYGRSSKPPSSASDNHKAYAKSPMARDCVAVVEALGFSDPFYVCSHDRGARVAHKLCVDFPEKVKKLVLLDIAPTLSMLEKTSADFAKAYWHWFFLSQPAPFPEKLITGQPEVFELQFFGGGYAGGKGFMLPEAKDAYVKQLRDFECVHAMCEDYRAAVTVDAEEARQDRKDGRKINCPVRVLWGKRGVIDKYFDALMEWKEVSEGEVSGEGVDSGHYVAEEVPDILLKKINEFLM